MPNEPSIKNPAATEVVRSTVGGVVSEISHDLDTDTCVVWVRSASGNPIPFGMLTSVGVGIKTHVNKGNIIGRRVKQAEPIPTLTDGFVLDDASAGLILGRLLGMPGTAGSLTWYVKPLAPIED